MSDIISERKMSAYKTIGFIGLGVMGEPICRNLVKKSGADANSGGAYFPVIAKHIGRQSLD